jgi:hypothetical protein
MRHARSLRIAINFTSACCMMAMGHAQVKIASPVPRRPQPAIDHAAEALRREAEAGIKERENDFARLKALPPAAPRALPVVRRGIDANRAGVPFPDNLAVVRGGVLVRLARVPTDRVANDEDEPPGPQFLVTQETFDFNVFGTTGDVDPARAYMETLLTKKIYEIGWNRPLTSVQNKKLQLAGRGDIKRLLDRIEDERKTFEHLRTDLDRCEEFLMRLQPLRLAIRRGPFGSESLFVKTLKKMRAVENLVSREPGLEARTPGR